MNSQEAIQFIKTHKEELIDFFAQKSKSMDDQLFICMAGSSGAGKTESAKGLIKRLGNHIVRIDADEIKEWIVGKIGGDLNNYHSAASLGVEKVLDYCIKKKKDIVLDGTFVDGQKGINNIKRALSNKRNYTVMIFYVYQDPHLAWDFIQKRAEITGRKVPYEKFKETFIQSIENVITAKKVFGDQIVIHMVKKNLNFSQEKYSMNISIKNLQSLQKNVILEYNKI